MTWLLPSALAIAGVAAFATLALHFIARSRPVAEPLPTARFIPDRKIHARTRSVALTDLLLLLTRVAALAMLGAAVAGPVFSSGGRVARIVIADRSRAVADIGAVRDSVRAYARDGDQLIVFDSAATLPRSATSKDSLGASGARGSLSAALAGAVRAAVRASAHSDSVEMVVISPFSEEEIDEATIRIRAAWPGRIRVVPVQAARVTGRSQRADVRAAPNDAVAAGLALMSPTAATVRVVRTVLTSEDSTWARSDGHVLVHWPASDADADWPRRATIDAVGGVAARGASLVARFPRLWELDGNAVARWSDGVPAAVERETGGGCIRDVAILVDESSDLTLRAPFRELAASLLAPCGGDRRSAVISAETIASLAGRGSLAPAVAMRDHSTDASRWTPWLLAIAAALLIVELAIRRSARRTP